MVKLNLFVVLALMPIAASAAPQRDGTATSGGGKGVVCRAADGTVKSVELLDLWEAREIYKRKIQDSSLPLEVQVKQGITSLKNIGDGETTNYSHKEKKQVPMPDSIAEVLQGQADLFLNTDPNNPAVERLRGKILTNTDDSFESARPADCGIEQLVYFEDAPEVPLALVNQDLVDHMNLTNQAALILHEALYRLVRYADGESDSRRVRRAIGYVFSGNIFEPIENMLGKKFVMCETADDNVLPTLYSRLYFYPHASGSLESVSSHWFGQTKFGFFPTKGTYQYFKSFDELFSYQNQDCSEKNDLSIANTVLPGAGPVDFAARSVLLYVCDHGKSALYLSPELAGRVLPAGAQKLACTIVEKP